MDETLSPARQARTALEATHGLLIALLPKLNALRADVTLKADDTPVTAADQLVQTEAEVLLRAHFQELTFVGEEDRAGWDEVPSGWVAVVDPIDGTENFASTLPEWGTAVSIFHEGAHVGSMIALPELGRRLITGDHVTYAHSRVTAFSSGITDVLARDLAATPQSRVMGAAVYNLYGVVTGRFARFINPVGAYSWDLLAGLQLALEHNCEVIVDDHPYDGRYLEPGTRYRVEVLHRYDRHPR
ncbi:inositol monophosphatase family protein [Nesterenkonia lutea]|uniref:Myo-inositol-1(Or 4)-monophosphatase n=1 Tax=Nesterenkonia lutea TaxID=272919 RepID=A0ABR9JBU7_9MICC|nr:inositol monophosphatase family protein [Nesterenkonia lutea]MBE1523404.1 myo-inositol-1(or 4)-monophosphatase [Nesterenkonia lutea]